MHLCLGWIGFYVSWQSTQWSHETTILIMILGKWIYQLFAHIQAKPTCWFNVLPLFFKCEIIRIMYISGPPAACHYTVASPVAGSYSKLYPDSTGTACTSLHSPEWSSCATGTILLIWREVLSTRIKKMSMNQWGELRCGLRTRRTYYARPLSHPAWLSLQEPLFCEVDVELVMDIPLQNPQLCVPMCCSDDLKAVSPRTRWNFATFQRAIEITSYAASVDTTT